AVPPRLPGAGPGDGRPLPRHRRRRPPARHGGRAGGRAPGRRPTARPSPRGALAMTVELDAATRLATDPPRDRPALTLVLGLLAVLVPTAWALAASDAIGRWTIALGIASSLPCALLGCYLVLRRMSLLGDAISHAVLPGIAVGFL